LTISPTARRIVAASAQLRAAPPVALDFLHSVLTQTSLPYRDPGDTVRSWQRRQGAAALSIEAGRIADPVAPAGFRAVGLPFGEKARLVLIHLTGEALRSGSPVIEVEASLTGFVRELGLGDSGGGRTIRTVRDQLTRLSVATVRLAWFGEGKASQVNSTLVTGLDLWAPGDGSPRELWPSTVTLSADYFSSIQLHAVPLARPAIRALSHSAMALDLYGWLGQRLHRIPKGKPQGVTWAALKAQFGPGYARERDFRREFAHQLRAVLAVYPDAHVTASEEGLELRHSRPPVAPRMVALKLAQGA
jgi:hypothetical protein